MTTTHTHTLNNHDNNANQQNKIRRQLKQLHRKYQKKKLIYSKRHFNGSLTNLGGFDTQIKKEITKHN